MTTKIVKAMYPTASYDDLLHHSNLANDVAAGIVAAVMVIWLFKVVVEVAIYAVGAVIALIWDEIKNPRTQR